MSGMSYEAFRGFRDAMVLERHPIRLDCMNAVRSLESEAPPLEIITPVSNPVLEVVLDLWRQRWGNAHSFKKIRTGTSIRSFLESLFDRMSSSHYWLCIPNDVYPVYWELAHKYAIKATGFPTVPEFQLSNLTMAPRRACLLLPHPLSPAGRYLTPDECEKLETWLNQSEDRWLILDAVYEFNFKANSLTYRLLKTGKVVLLHSLSKGWLAPRTFAVATYPPKWPPQFESESTELSPEQLKTTHTLMSRFADKPQHLQTLFQTRWQNLTPRLKQWDQNWAPPKSGYFSFLNISAQALLKRHNVLAIPSSVFGSDSNVSIITCLHESLGNRN